jgi:hypothetical protein
MTDSRHVMASTNMHATTAELLENVFSVRSMPRLYNEAQLLIVVGPSRVRVESLETAIKRVGGWCEMAASLRGGESGSRGTSTVERRYQATQ